MKQRLGVDGTGFGVRFCGLGCRVWGLGLFRGFRIEGLGFRV